MGAGPMIIAMLVGNTLRPPEPGQIDRPGANSNGIIPAVVLSASSGPG